MGTMWNSSKQALLINSKDTFKGCISTYLEIFGSKSTNEPQSILLICNGTLPLNYDSIFNDRDNQKSWNTLRSHSAVGVTFL